MIKQFPPAEAGLPSLAFLVNESRARRPELSADFVSRYWIPPQLLASVAGHWKRYADQVYPYDDLVVSIRNHYFLKQLLSASTNVSTCFLNLAAGLTSYPYSLRDDLLCIEVDLPELVTFKSRRRLELVRARELTDRKVIDLSGDVARQPLLDILTGELSNIAAARRRVILLEGLSYYLQERDWNRLMDELARLLLPGDLLMFDYWSELDASNPVFERFRMFCNAEFSIQLDTFHFLRLESGLIHPDFLLVEKSAVVEQDAILGTGMLADRTHDIIPECYAILQRR